MRRELTPNRPSSTLKAVLLVLLASVVLAAPSTRGPVAVMVTSKRPGADRYARQVAQRVLDSLMREDIAALDPGSAARALKEAGGSDARTCQGRRACVSKLAVLLGEKAVVVSVDVGKLSNSLDVHVEAIATDTASPLAVLDITAPTAPPWPEHTQVSLVVFARQLSEQLAFGKVDADAGPQRPPDVELRDPPRAEFEPRVQPELETRHLETRPVDAPASNRVAAWSLAGGAALAAATAITTCALGLQDKARYDAALQTMGELRGTSLTRTDAFTLAGSANLKFSIALTTAILSAAFTALAVFFAAA